MLLSRAWLKSDKRHNATATYFPTCAIAISRMAPTLCSQYIFLPHLCTHGYGRTPKMKCGQTLCWSVAISRQSNVIQHPVTQCEIHFLIGQLGSVEGSAACRYSHQEISFALCEMVKIERDIWLWNLIAKYIPSSSTTLVHYIYCANCSSMCKVPVNK